MPTKPVRSSSLYTMTLLTAASSTSRGQDGSRRRASLGELIGTACLPAVGDGTSHGTYYWHQLSSTLHVKISGGQSLEIRTEPVVQVKARIEMSIDDFYADRYVANVASVLGIDPSRIKVVSIRAGGVITEYIITPSEAELAALEAPIQEVEYDTSQNADPESMASLVLGFDENGTAIVNETALAEEVRVREAIAASEPPPPPQAGTLPPKPPAQPAGSGPRLSEVAGTLDQAITDGTMAASLANTFEGATYSNIGVAYTAVEPEYAPSPPPPSPPDAPSPPGPRGELPAIGQPPPPPPAPTEHEDGGDDDQQLLLLAILGAVSLAFAAALAVCCRASQNARTTLTTKVSWSRSFSWGNDAAAEKGQLQGSSEGVKDFQAVNIGEGNRQDLTVEPVTPRDATPWQPARLRGAGIYLPPPHVVFGAELPRLERQGSSLERARSRATALAQAIRSSFKRTFSGEREQAVSSQLPATPVAGARLPVPLDERMRAGPTLAARQKEAEEKAVARLRRNEGVRNVPQRSRRGSERGGLQAGGTNEDELCRGAGFTGSVATASTVPAPAATHASAVDATLRALG